MQKTIVLNPLKIDYTQIFFFGSDEEQAAAEATEAARAAELEKIFFDPAFVAAEYRTPNGARRILHHSTRPGILFQLSYIAADGVPVMHENFIETEKTAHHSAIDTKKELLNHFILESNETPLFLKVVTA